MVQPSATGVTVVMTRQKRKQKKQDPYVDLKTEHPSLHVCVEWGQQAELISPERQ